jgi:hypothetical protein
VEEKNERTNEQNGNKNVINEKINKASRNEKRTQIKRKTDGEKEVSRIQM